MNTNHAGNKISVIMPALNEEANIADAISETLAAFASLGIDGNIIAINDGSTDKTQEIIEQKARESPMAICFIKHDTTKGIGVCFWEGVDCADGDIVVMIPGDNENNPRETLRYYRLLEHVDIVIPFIFNREVRPLVRNMLSLIYRIIVNITFLVNFTYTNGTVLYRKSILRQLHSRSEGFFFQTDILVRSVKKGYLFAEVPYKLGLRQRGESKAVTFPSLYKVVKGYFRLVKDYYSKRDIELLDVFPEDSQTAMRRQG